MSVPAHRHRETFSHLIGSYGYILYGRVANPLYIDVRLVAHGQSPVPCLDPLMRPYLIVNIISIPFAVIGCQIKLFFDTIGSSKISIMEKKYRVYLGIVTSISIHISLYSKQSCLDRLSESLWIACLNSQG